LTNLAVGVDFGGTRIKAGVVEDGRLLQLESCDTPAGGPGTVLDAIASTVRRLGVPQALGVAIPGEVDPQGRCYRLPNVAGFEGVDIRAELEARLGCSVSVENDSTSAALGELLHGHGRSFRSFLVATLGTGVGGGLVIDGTLRRGAHGFGAEIGHILVDTSADAWPCPCGLRGCMESRAGTVGLVRHYRDQGGRAAEPSDVAVAAARGDVRALETFRFVGHALGMGLAQVQKIVDLDALVFAGGISASFTLIEPALRETLRAQCFGPPTAEVPLVVSELGSHGGVIGAACLVGR
jgi:glucokinase